MGTALKNSAASGFDYVAAGVDDKKIQAFLEKAADIVSVLTRRGTEDVFEYGAVMEQAIDAFPSEASLSDWLAKKCDMTVRHARNFAAIHRVLAPVRERCIDLKIKLTPLIEMAKATSIEQIEAALKMKEETGRLTVAQAKELCGESSEKAQISDNLFENGGADGLRALVAQKTRVTIPSFLGHVAELTLEINAALAGKRVLKAKLAEALEGTARVASQELMTLAQVPAPTVGSNRHGILVELPDGSHWRDAQKVLGTLGNIFAWPESKGVEGWLHNEVLPVLDWIASKSPAPEWPIKHTTIIQFPTPAALNQSGVAMDETLNEADELEVELTAAH